VSERDGSRGSGRITARLRAVTRRDVTIEEDPLVVLDDDELVFLGEALPPPTVPQPVVPPNDALASPATSSPATSSPATSSPSISSPSTSTTTTPPEPASAPPSAPSAPPASPARNVPAADDGSPPAPPVIRIGFDSDVPAEDPAELGAVASVAPDSIPTDRPAGLEPSLAPPGRRTITIADESLVDEPDGTTPAGVDPRFRARRIGVLRSVGRRRLRIASVIGTVVVLVVGTVVLLKSPLLSVQRVRLDGAAYVDRGRLAALVSDLSGTPLVDVDTGAVEAVLEADPWVKRARVERDWFSGVRMDIVERVPVATFMGEDQGWRIVDSTGAVIATLEPGHKPLDVVTVQASGPGPDLDPGSVATGPLATAAAIAPRLPGRLHDALDHLAVADDGSVDLVLAGDGRIVLGRPERLRDKLISSMVAIDTVELEAIEVLDVSTPERPVLTMRTA
jgi:cell division protein FtsQ